MNELETLLYDSSKQFNLELSQYQINQFMQYMNILIETNKKFNLTAITDEKEIILKHFVDCLSIVSFFDLNKSKSMIDIGSGAGFPAIPIKIAFPDINITIVDSLNKRINFLKDLSESLSLNNLEFLHERAEVLGQDKNYREKYDVCTSRAVAYLPMLSEYCIPFVKKNGFFIAMKGIENLDEEVKNSKEIISLLGGNIEKKEQYEIPFTEISHALLFIKKVEATPRKFPRPSNKIQKRA